MAKMSKRKGYRPPRRNPWTRTLRPQAAIDRLNVKKGVAEMNQKEFRFRNVGDRGWICRLS